MRFVDAPFPPGSIVAPQDHLGRYPDFEISLEKVQVPKGSLLFRPRGGSMTLNCNIGVRSALHSGKGTWIWFIDDDQTFQPDIILRLLEHDKDLVAPIVPMRYPPFKPVLYKELDINMEKREFICTPYEWEELGSGLMKVNGLPKSGLLVKERVWKALSDPWFRMGLIQPDQIDDDRVFMVEIRQAGYELWADLDQVVPHITSGAISVTRNSLGHYEKRISIAGAELALHEVY